MVELVSKTPKTTWIMSNLGVKPMDDLKIPDEEKRIGGLARHYIIEDWKGSGLKVGFFGTAEKEWLEMMSPNVNESLYYESFIDCANRMCHFLKNENQCDVVIALTHMRIPNDKILAESVKDIDLILGGHDHCTITECDTKTGVFVIKSGTDFEEFSDLQLHLDV